MNPAEYQRALDEMREYYWSHGCLPKGTASEEELADEIAQQIMEAMTAAPPAPPTIH